MRVRANGSFPNPSVLPQFVKHEADGRLRNRETETFAAATCAQDEGIDPNQTSIPIDQGPLRLPGLMGASVCTYTMGRSSSGCRPNALTIPLVTV